MAEQDRPRHERSLLVLLLCLAAALRVFFLLKFENMPGDAVGNVERALSILEDPRLSANYDGNSSTLYKYALAGFMRFWRDPLLAPRAFSVLFGTLFVIPYYKTLRLLFSSRVAFFSALTLVFYPLHVIQSSVTTADAAYYFFLFSSFFHFFNYLKEKKEFKSLVFSALFFNVAALLRFESWIFIPLFFIFLWPKEKGRACLFVILLSLFPCGMLYLNHLYQRDFLYTFHLAAKTGHASIVTGRFAHAPRLWSWVKILWEGSGPGLVFGGLLGMALALIRRRSGQLALFFLILWAVFTWGIFAARMVPNHRYSIVLGLLMIPYAWFLVERLSDRLKVIRGPLFIVFLAILAAGFIPRARRLITRTSEMFCTTPQEITRIAAWLKEHVRENETLVMEADPQDVFPSNILIRSGISPWKSRLVYTPLSQGWFLRKNEAPSLNVLERRPDYLVLNSEGFLRQILGFDPQKTWQSLGGAFFRVVYVQAVPGYGTFFICRGFY